MLTSKTPLAELAPVPLLPDEDAINADVDAAICASYRRWRSKGNAARPHVESWCPSGR